MLFRLRDASQIAALRQALTDALDIDSLRPVGGAGAWLLHSRSLDVGYLIAALHDRSDILYVEPDVLYFSMQSGPVPNDPNFSLEWALANTGQTIRGTTGTPGDDIHAEGAWSISTGSRSILVGVVDTGIDGGNADIAPNLWHAANPFTLTIGGNTFNCAAGTSGFSSVSGDSYCIAADSDVVGHGTWVASAIGATGNNGSGYAGVDWAVSLLDLRAATPSGTPFEGQFYADDAASAIEAGIQIKQDLGASADLKVINLSYGTTPTGDGYSQTMYDEIARAQANGILVVASAGNESTYGVDYPAADEQANELAVGGSSQNDARTSDTNYGPGVQLSAPGQNIWGWTMNGESLLGDGTSPAAAFVSGAAALVLTHCTLDPIGLRATLMGTADVVSGLSGASSTGARLNAYNAITSCAGTPGTAQVSITGTGHQSWYGQIPPSGTVVVTIDGNQFQTAWSGIGGTSLSIAQNLAKAISSPYYTASASGTSTAAVVMITATAAGPYTNSYAYSTQMVDSCVPHPPYTCGANPFTASGSGNFTGGHN